jgi:FkbM family methyltransferase
VAHNFATHVKESIYAGLDRLSANRRIRWTLIKTYESLGTALGAGNYDDDGVRTGENRVLGAVGSMFARPLLLDIGANNGSWTLEARARIPRSRVICIEPGSKALATLRDRTAGDTNVFILPVALGETNARVELFGVDDAVRASLNSDLLARTTRSGHGDIPSEPVELRTWPAAMALIKEAGISLEEEELTLIKVDIEGLELNVLGQLVEWSGFSAVQVVQVEFNMHAIAQGQLISDFQSVLGPDFVLFRLSKHALIPLSELTDASANFFGFSNWVAVRSGIATTFQQAFKKASGQRMRPYKWRC